MTRKDFVLIAEVLKKLGQDEAHCFDSHADRIAIADRFADALRQTNESFDRGRFMEAATSL